MNLVFLKKSRKKPQVGDVFVFQLTFEPEQYRFGMVVSTTMKIMSMENVTLVYIYDHLGKGKDNYPDFSAKKLLLPPQAINNLGWSRGFFETVTHLDLEKHLEYKLQQHHFKWPVHAARTDYFDENNNGITNPIEPIGMHASGNHRTVEDMVCHKLGYPLAKD